MGRLNASFAGFWPLARTCSCLLARVLVTASSTQRSPIIILETKSRSCCCVSTRRVSRGEHASRAIVAVVVMFAMGCLLVWLVTAASGRFGGRN